MWTAKHYRPHQSRTFNFLWSITRTWQPSEFVDESFTSATHVIVLNDTWWWSFRKSAAFLKYCFCEIQKNVVILWQFSISFCFIVINTSLSPDTWNSVGLYITHISTLCAWSILTVSQYLQTWRLWESRIISFTNFNTQFFIH